MLHCEHLEGGHSRSRAKVGMSHKINYLVCVMHPTVINLRYHINRSIY